MVPSAPLRPELASVCSYLALKRAGSVIREAPRSGILAQLATGKGLQ
jgi:hypothetical protein